MAKNRILYALLIIILILFVFLYEKSVTYMALYTSIILPIVSLVVVLLTRRRFIVSQKLDMDTIVKGEKANYILSIKNKSIFPCFGIKAVYSQASTAIVTDMRTKQITLAPFGKHDLSFMLEGRFRGVFDVGAGDIFLYDMLGLFRFRQKISESLCLTVLPRTVDIHFLPLSTVDNESNANRHQRSDEDYSVISDLRQYQSSDHYKKIHWKMSAKKNELIVKNYNTTVKETAVLILDNTLSDGTAEKNIELEDKMMEAFVSVMAHCLKRHYTVLFRYIGEDESTDFTGESNFDSLYIKAANILFSENSFFDNYLENIEKRMMEFSNIFIFARKLSKEFFETVFRMRIFGHNVVVFCFFTPTDEGNLFTQKITEAGAYVYWMDDIDGVATL